MTRPVVSKIFWNVNNDNDRCWKNATTLFSLRTFIFTMTGAEKKLSSYFCFPDDRSWKKRQLFCLHTFTFTMTGTGKNNFYVSTLSHSWSLCSNGLGTFCPRTNCPRAYIVPGQNVPGTKCPPI